MFSDDVRLDVNPRAGPQLAQSRLSQCVLDQRDLQAARLEIVDGETDAIDGNGSVEYKKLRERRWNRDVDKHCITFALDCDHGPHTIDVPLNDVPAQPIAGAQRTLEIHSGSLLPLPDHGPLERGGHGGRFEPPAGEFTD